MQDNVPLDRPTAPAKKPRIFKWALLGVGAGVALMGVIFFACYPPETLPSPSPGLPEWFDPAYRIKKNRGIIFPPKTAIQPKGTPYTDAWLEEHFTHYIGTSNAFIWSTPKVKYPSDGKILAGIKVIVGEQVNDLSLICTLTPDGRPENMYVPSALLRDRSEGPPPVQNDD